MGAKSSFRKLGEAYLAAVEGAIGCRVDADYPNKTFQLADLAATMHQFYEEWAPTADGLTTGVLVGEGSMSNGQGDLHSAREIKPKLREACEDEPGIYFIIQLNMPKRIRSLLMFADAILFWDPLENSFRQQGVDSEIVALALDYIRELRPLIAEGLVVPAQLARARKTGEAPTIATSFEDALAWQSALGKEGFESRTVATGPDSFELTVPEKDGFMAIAGLRGHSENKLASLLLPDLVVPLMDYSSLGDYQDFCVSLDATITPHELKYVHESLAFDSGFILDPDKIDSAMLIELRDRDAIFHALRQTLVDAVQEYETQLAAGQGAMFIRIFNQRLQNAFRELKEKAIVSNTWKEFVDESRTFSGKVLAKVATAPLTGKAIAADMFEAAASNGVSSAGALMAASLKTYVRYRNTKVLMDFAGAIRDKQPTPGPISI